MKLIVLKFKWFSSSCLEVKVLDLQGERLHGGVVWRVEVGVGPWREVAAADVGAPDAVVEAGVGEVPPKAKIFKLFTTR